MIQGIGTDIVDIAALRVQLADPASSFAAATFTATERRTCASRPGADATPYLAARFAAKEAYIKAWSAGNYGQKPTHGHVDLREIEVVSDSYGRPSLRLHGAVAAAATALGPMRRHLSLSHDGPIATAFVILERE